GAILIAGAFGAYTVRAVYAQTTTPTPNPSAPAPGKGMHFGWKGGYSDQDLADALGISLDKLHAAYQTANAEALKQAVSKGLLTQQQADRLSQKLDSHFAGQFERFSGSGIDYDALLANALGISVDQLKTAYQKAFTTNIDNAVKNGRLTQEQADNLKGRYALSNDTKFQDSLKAAFQAAVKQAVADGIITQAQADQILKNQTAGGFPGFFMHGFGPRGRFGPGHGLKGGNPEPNSSPTTAPSSSSSGL
ncbi:MAG TPA: hypothetical protein VMT46_07860, partial [Anaerolineaceae bacterium]|nr:hypothetical protein [Anaerolineaceae bacterium]